jgi:four helix bundle protein
MREGESPIATEDNLKYAEWMQSMPTEITGDPLWKTEVYRLAIFVADVGWHDVTKLMKDRRTLDLANQLYRALGSIGANVSEGYSRGTGKDRARFYGYALGSARESRGWYFNSRHVLDQKVASHRMQLLTQIIRLLLTMIPEQRGSFFNDESPPYRTSSEIFCPELPLDGEALKQLLDDIPLP